MKIDYEDEYGNKLYQKPAGDFQPPFPGDTVVIDGQDWIVKSRAFIPQEQTVIVYVAEHIMRTQRSENSETGRLNEIHNVILALNKRQDTTEKKSRALNEQIGSIRKNINQRIQRESKERKDI
jgi:hypothetical protein